MTTRGNLTSADPYNLYYDINVVSDYNPTLVGTTAPPLTFNEIRQNPIIKYPEDYLLSVVRFSIETPTLPIFIPQVLLGQSNPNKLIYAWGMSVTDYSGVAPVTDYLAAQENWIYIPDDLTIDPPSGALTFQDLTTEYYYVNEFSLVLQYANNALKAAFDNFNAQLVAAGKSALGTTAGTPANISQNYCPQMFYDPNGELFSLSFPLCPPALAGNAPPYNYDTYDQNLALTAGFTGRVIKLYMNTPLSNLLNSFPTVFQGNDQFQLTTGTEDMLVVYNNQFQNTNGGSRPSYPLTPVASTVSAIPQILLPQEHSTTILFSPISSLVFSTSLLPVQNTLLSKPAIFNFYDGVTSSNLRSSGNNNVTAPVLTDFELQGATGTSSQTRITYTPTAEYRMLDLRGTTPVNAVEVSVFWKDKYSGLHRFNLAAGCAASIKILFRRKDFYNATID
jgi:hypothetical protein